MQFYFTKIIIFFFLFTSHLYSEIINEVFVEGNKRISKNTIIVLGDIKLKSNYDDNKLNDIISSLYKTNYFDDVKIIIENNILKIFVKENLIIEEININGIKNNSLKQKILDNIFLRERSSFTENLLSKDISLIKDLLKINGYFYSTVQPSIEIDNDLNSVKIKIDINQGSRSKIKKITFIGNNNIKSKKLFEVITSEEHKFWKFLTRNVYLNEERINLDKRLISNYYKNFGFYNVIVENSFAELNNENFDLVYSISEGEEYYFNDIKLNLPEDYNNDDFNIIYDFFKKLKGKKYSLNSVNSILEKLEEVASSRTYDFISANVVENVVDNNQINFTFNIKDSEKLYVEKINILGNFQTYEEVIRNRFLVDEGDPLNNILFNKTINNIKSLGIFKSVKSIISEGSSDNLRIIDIQIEEKPTGEIFLAAGIGTSGSTLGFGLAEKNFLGKGINLNTSMEVSEDTIQGSFIYSKPNFAYTDNTLSTGLVVNSKDYLSDFGYKVDEKSFSIGTSFEQFQNYFYSPKISISLEDLETNSTASTQLKKQQGSYEDLYFIHSIDYDLRNSSYNSSDGTRLIFSQELPIISGNNEIMNSINFTKYKSFDQTNDMIGKASFYFKSINSLDSSDVRISKRAQIPYNKLRGFEKGKIGPIDGNDYIGGNYVSSINFSTNLPNLLSTVENIDFSYFIDLANVWGVDYDKSIDNSNVVRSSTGIGMDLITPIGPLSFSLTQPLTKKSSDKTETFRFNLGTTF